MTASEGTTSCNHDSDVTHDRVKGHKASTIPKKGTCIYLDVADRSEISILKTMSEGKHADVEMDGEDQKSVTKSTRSKKSNKSKASATTPYKTRRKSAIRGSKGEKPQ